MVFDCRIDLAHLLQRNTFTVESPRRATLCVPRRIGIEAPNDKHRSKDEQQAYPTAANHSPAPPWLMHSSGLEFLRGDDINPPVRDRGLDLRGVGFRSNVLSVALLSFRVVVLLFSAVF